MKGLIARQLLSLHSHCDFFGNACIYGYDTYMYNHVMQSTMDYLGTDLSWLQMLHCKLIADFVMKCGQILVLCSLKKIHSSLTRTNKLKNNGQTLE